MVSFDALPWRRSPSALGVFLHHNCLEFVLLATNEHKSSGSIKLTDAHDLSSPCESIAEVCRTVLGAEVGAVSCWIATDQASATTASTTVGSHHWLRPAIDAATAGLLATTLATHLAHLSDTDSPEHEPNASLGEDWVEIARAQSAPAMDYLLLPDEPIGCDH